MQYEHISNHPRYHRTSRTSNTITNLNLSRIEPTRDYIVQNSHNAIPTAENRWNPELYYDVNYNRSDTSTATTAKRHIITKPARSYNHNTDIALYDTRVYGLNADNVQPGKMQANLLERARNKIQFSNQDLIENHMKLSKPSCGCEPSPEVMNQTSYNPYLPRTETNKPSQPFMLDDRVLIGNTVFQRDFNYETDRANIAYDLQRSEHIKDRNRRQVEAEQCGQRHCKINRWVEPKQQYKNQIEPGFHIMNDTELRSISKDNDRNNPTEQQLSESFVTSRNEFSANDINNLATDVYGSFMPQYERDMRSIFDNSVMQSRESFNENNNRGILLETFDFITDTIKSAFGIKSSHEDRLVRGDTPEHYRAPFETENYKATFDNTLMTSLEPFVTEYYNRFHQEPSHVLVMNKKDIFDTYPDEDFSNTATSVITAGKYDTGLLRSMALYDNDKLMFVQKNMNEAMFNDDSIDTDYTVVELPVEALDNKFREKINKYRMGTNRDKVLELTYHDFVMLNDYVNAHPELKQRFNRDAIHQKLRTNGYDKDIVDNYDRGAMFVDNKVYTNLADNARRRDPTHQKSREDVYIDDNIRHTNPDSFIPQRSTSLQGTRLPYIPSDTDVNRRQGVKRGAIDKLNDNY